MIKHDRYKTLGETILRAARKRERLPLRRVLETFLPLWSLAAGGTHWQETWYCFSLVPSKVALDSGWRPFGPSPLTTFQVAHGV